MFDLEYYNYICDCGKYIKEYINHISKINGAQFRERIEQFIPSDTRINNLKYNEVMSFYNELVGKDYIKWYLSWFNHKYNVINNRFDNFIKLYPDMNIT
jgi:hypothetical protein